MKEEKHERLQQEVKILKAATRGRWGTFGKEGSPGYTGKAEKEAKRTSGGMHPHANRVSESSASLWEKWLHRGKK